MTGQADVLASRIREYRLAKELTQRRLARAIGVHLHSVAGYESGRSRPSRLTLAKIVSVLDMPIDGIDIDSMRPRSPHR